MINASGNFCARSEYDHGRRLGDADLRINTVYTAMASLCRPYRGFEAVQNPIRIKEIDEREFGGRVLFISALDMDLHVIFGTVLIVEGSNLLNIAHDIVAVDPVNGARIPLESGYLTRYDDGVDRSGLEEARAYASPYSAREGVLL